MYRSFAALLLVTNPCAVAPVTNDAGDHESLGDEQPAELGLVDWGRDHDAAFERARLTGRPVFLLFQEIPGCSTCQNFGSGPLSSRLMVEAIQQEFIPLCVQNNRPGADARWLKHYREPAWNNPVVRFFETGGTELLPRADGIWGEAALAERMIGALTAAARPVPEYLRIARDEANQSGRSRAAFAMHCFWVGEAALGAVDGVRETRAGWLDGREVVELGFDPEVTSIEDLVRAARRADSADRLYVEDAGLLARARAIQGLDVRAWSSEPKDAKPSDQRRHLRASELRFLPLTPLQEVRINAALASGKAPRAFLSPGQIDLLEAVTTRLRTHPGSLDGLEWTGGEGDEWSHRRRLEARLGK